MDIEKRLTEIEIEVCGDGRSHLGLAGRVTRIEALLYADAKTGERGLVAEVRLLLEYVQNVQASLRTLNWIMAFLGFSGISTLLYLLFMQN